MVQQAPDTRINEVRRLERDRVAAMNVIAYNSINKVRKVINERLPMLQRIRGNKKKFQTELNKIEKLIVDEYGVMFTDFKSMIVDGLNASGIEQRYLAQLALGQQIKWNKATLYKELPKTDPFEITNRILSQKSILRRNKALARRVTNIIADNLDKTLKKSIAETTKLVEIELGFRDKRGLMTKKTLDLLKSGRFTHTNGNFYVAYRISRTEQLRMASIQANNVTEELQTRYDDVRLKMISKLDSRTRTQSRMMNNQISRKDLKFRYPNGKYYKHGQQPVQWLVFDREATITVFLDDSIPREKQDFADVNDYKQSLEGTLYK